jgi:hypothetical protein
VPSKANATSEEDHSVPAGTASATFRIDSSVVRFPPAVGRSRHPRESCDKFDAANSPE